MPSPTPYLWVAVALVTLYSSLNLGEKFLVQYTNQTDIYRAEILLEARAWDESHGPRMGITSSGCSLSSPCEL